MSIETGPRGLGAEHIGSLVHPGALPEVFLRYDRGEASEQELFRAQQVAVAPCRRRRRYRPGAMATCPAWGQATGALALDKRSSSGRLSSQW